MVESGAMLFVYCVFRAIAVFFVLLLIRLIYQCDFSHHIFFRQSQVILDSHHIFFSARLPVISVPGIFHVFTTIFAILSNNIVLTCFLSEEHDTRSDIAAVPRVGVLLLHGSCHLSPADYYTRRGSKRIVVSWAAV